MIRLAFLEHETVIEIDGQPVKRFEWTSTDWTGDGEHDLLPEEALALASGLLEAAVQDGVTIK